jgi:hypothetical protein
LITEPAVLILDKHKMWGLFSKDPAKDFAFEIGEQIGQVTVKIILTMFKKYSYICRVK